MDKKFKIKEHITDLSDANSKGWKKELNLVSWYGAEPKYDIRSWSESHKDCSKGVTLSYEEIALLGEALQEKGII